MSDFYAGIFVIDLSDGMVLSVSDASHPGEMKMAGGMSKEGESPEQTVYRECTEELRTQILDCTLAYVERVQNRTGGNHFRYFFLADRVSGALEKGAVWQVEEKDISGRVKEKLIAKWVPILEFADKLFYKQYNAFGAVLSMLACRDVGFCQKYSTLLKRFPEPEDLGLGQK